MDIILNKKFHIKYDENLIETFNTDQPAETAKVEPRVMEVLKILIENNNSVVTRETLIDRVWKNYGGGDDGLTQAISFLRKTLSDHGKTLIETISKKGYKLNSTLSNVMEVNIHNVNVNKGINSAKGNKIPVDKRFIWAGYAIITLICFLVVFMFYQKFFGNNHTSTPKALNPDQKENGPITPQPDKPAPKPDEIQPDAPTPEPPK